MQKYIAIKKNIFYRKKIYGFSKASFENETKKNCFLHFELML